MILQTVSIVAAVSAAGAAFAQTIQLRWVERHGQSSFFVGSMPVANDGIVGSGVDSTYWLALEARIVGGGLLGISGFSGNAVTNEPFGTRGFFWGAESTQPGAAAGSMVNSARANASFEPNYRGYTDSSGVPLATGRGIFNPFRADANSGDLAQGVLNDTDLAMPGLQTPEFNGVYGLSGRLTEADYLANVSPAGGNPAGSPSHFGVDGWVPLFIIGYNITLPLPAPRVVTFSFDGTVTAFSEFVDGQPVPALTSSASGVYSVVIFPSPGTAVILGLGAAMALRRRRS